MRDTVINPYILYVLIHAHLHSWNVLAFAPYSRPHSSKIPMHAIAVGKNYKPKWKKLETIVDKEGKAGGKEAGLTGTVSVIFKMGEETTTTMASVGQPIQDVASQAGQYIKYGCGKGECGTCQALCNGQYIKPCVAVIPADMDGQEYVIQVKAVKNKSRSSGKFYSARSFVMGFYNNLLGMIGFVRDRRKAKNNYNDRITFEEIVKQKAAERKALKRTKGYQD